MKRFSFIKSKRFSSMSPIFIDIIYTTRRKKNAKQNPYIFYKENIPSFYYLYYQNIVEKLKHDVSDIVYNYNYLYLYILYIYIYYLYILSIYIIQRVAKLSNIALATARFFHTINTPVYVSSFSVMRPQLTYDFRLQKHHLRTTSDPYYVC